MAEPLSDRARDVLHAIIREYISTGDPVGSQQLARTSGFEVSSATLRNVMADLEELGYLEKPHTSAGRVPTDRAYRFYIDTLIRLRDPNPRDRDLIQRGIASGAPFEDALQGAGRILHFLTRHAGVVVTPRPTSGTFHRIEFVRLREGRVLAILVDQDAQVHNRPVALDFEMSQEELVRASNYLSELLEKLPLEQIRGRIEQELAQDQAAYDQLAAKALKLGLLATGLPPTEKVFIEGTGSFLEAPEFADIERMKALFRTLEEKTRLVSLLDRVQRAREMQIFIGHESDLSPGGEVSLVATPYGPADRSLGTVGVIGPTRMNYQRVIPLVQFTAQVLSSALKD
ncbi:MAG TPA: heat-inducible transcriptional repressor HrcA [Myxococcaceae bacterium]|nr:heat-inducible transcriptional repressor HrcA [Myxococcaceae bacterium]